MALFKDKTEVSMVGKSLCICKNSQIKTLRLTIDLTTIQTHY